MVECVLVGHVVAGSNPVYSAREYFCCLKYIERNDKLKY